MEEAARKRQQIEKMRQESMKSGMGGGMGGGMAGMGSGRFQGSGSGSFETAQSPGSYLHIKLRVHDANQRVDLSAQRILLSSEKLGLLQRQRHQDRAWFWGKRSQLQNSSKR